MGYRPQAPRGLADLVMSVIEGAPLLSRATHSTEPLGTTVDALAQVIENSAGLLLSMRGCAGGPSGLATSSGQMRCDLREARSGANKLV